MIANRIIYKISITAAGDYKGNGVTGTGVLIEFNKDLLVASIYQSEDDTGSTTDGSKWCSAWDNKVMKDGSATTLKAQYGLTGRTKCTWFMTAEDNTVGISFKVTKAESLTNDMQWFEFASTDALESSSVLPTTSVPDYFLGGFDASSNTNGAVFLNPLKTSGFTGWGANGINRWAEYTNPSMYIGGSIGMVKYFPGLAGDQMESQELEMDVYNVQQMYGITNANNAAYNTALGEYNPLREAYDSAVTAEGERVADVLKAAFEPMVTIP